MGSRYKTTAGILLALSCVLSVGVWLYRESNVPEEVKALRWIQHADAVADAKAALAQGRHSLRGIHGLGLRVPHSAPNLSTTFLDAYGVEPILGTTDGLVNDEHFKLVRKAAQYALAYNNYILAHYTPPAVLTGARGNP